MRIILLPVKLIVLLGFFMPFHFIIKDEVKQFHCIICRTFRIYNKLQTDMVVLIGIFIMDDELLGSSPYNAQVKPYTPVLYVPDITFYPFFHLP